jgi:hypothetical protein
MQDLQVLYPKNRGSLGIRELNLRLEEELNPLRADQPVVEKFGWRFRPGDKVIQWLGSLGATILSFLPRSSDNSMVHSLRGTGAELTLSSTNPGGAIAPPGRGRRAEDRRLSL